MKWKNPRTSCSVWTCKWPQKPAPQLVALVPDSIFTQLAVRRDHKMSRSERFTSLRPTKLKYSRTSKQTPHLQDWARSVGVEVFATKTSMNEQSKVKISRRSATKREIIDFSFLIAARHPWRWFAPISSMTHFSHTATDLGTARQKSGAAFMG
jgi:hypothetical protein